MSPEQCRAARAWLNWSQDELAAKAQVSNSTVREFEAARRVPIANNLAAIRRALEDAGIEFLFSRGDEEPCGIAQRHETGGPTEFVSTAANQRTAKRTGR
jgi:transcriptional regulator with XRE-family HTH domain